MAKKSDRKALGRGLSALLGDQSVAEAVAPPAAPARDAAPEIAIDLIHANPEQPRKSFNDKDLKELAASIREHGVIQPVVIRPNPTAKGTYQIVAGERRWRAAQLAGIHVLPAIIRDLDDREVLELGIVENIQRVDLDPVEEAQGYAQLIESFGYTQEALSNVIGKSRSHLANMMRLLALPEHVLTMMRTGKLSPGHARALITAPDPVGLAEQAVLKGLSVRQVEALARQAPEAKKVTKGAPATEKDADTKLLEGDLSAAIGMRVTIEHQLPHGGGELRIRYKTLDDLDRLCQKLTE
ncbi:MAG: ParB/RepB/Spo0J family partition protein [Pseudomonadota bacterium]